jgi:lysozyme
MIFIYVKASEGNTLKDPQFEENWKQAKRVGMLRGAYHFLSSEQRCRTSSS